MRKILDKILNRVFIFALLLILQISWFVIVLRRLTDYSTAISVVFTLLSFIAVLWLINKDDNPAYKIGWIVMIMAVPLLGGLFYLIFGHKQPSKKLRRRLEAEQRRTAEALRQDAEVIELVRREDDRVAGQVSYISSTGGFPVYMHTQTKYYSVGDDMFPDLVEELRGAEHFIFMEFYIVAFGRMWDTILEILEEKAAAGLDVRFIYDDIGCVTYLPPDYSRQLEEKGIRCIAFNPFIPVFSLVMNNRDHRKIAVIDGHTAFSGGVNLADEYINEKERFGHWKDTAFRLKGDAVWNYTVMFLQMWNAFRHTDENYDPYRPHVWHGDDFVSEGFVQPYADSPLDDEILAENVYLNIINQARRYVYIFTPYLIIDHEMQTALCLAAKRGVDVRLVTPHIPDKKTVFQLTRSYYPPLLKSGVRIYEYTPGFIHAKSYVCDDEIAVVGTINMDYRSLYLHFECGTYFYKCPLVADVKKDAVETLEKSHEIGPQDMRQGFFGGLLCAVLRVFSPLL